MKMESVENSQAALTDAPEYRSYPIRWYILATLSLLNISNAMIWLAFAPIAYTTADFYNTDLNTVNMLSVVFMITGIPCGICATWLIDTFGLRWSIVASAWLNCIGALLRVVSAVEGVADPARLPLLFTGQVMAACAQPFMLFAPTKLSAVWFPEDQRAIANTIASMSNPLGIMIACVTSPVLAPTADRMLFMLVIQSIPAILAALMASFGVCSNEPKTPPSPSAETNSIQYWEGIKALARNKNYLLLAWAIGSGIALFSVLITLLSQILCPWGYSDKFAGAICGGTMIGVGFVGAAIAGVTVDITKRFMETVKLCFSGAVLALVMFAIVHNNPGIGWVIALACAIFGFFGLPVYPVGNELGVETTYPVGEATSSGIMFMVGQLLGILLILLMQLLGREMTEEELDYSVCKTGNTTTGDPIPVIDMSVSMYVFVGYGVITCIIFVLVFQTSYRRIEAEEHGNQDEFQSAPKLATSSSDYKIGQEISGDGDLGVKL